LASRVQGLGLGLELEGPGLGLVLGLWILALTTTLFITNIAASLKANPLGQNPRSNPSKDKTLPRSKPP